MRTQTLNTTHLGKHFEGRNFMTPDVMEYGRSGKYVWELSTGYGIDHDELFGVTVVKVEDGKPDEKMFMLSKCFHSLEEAERHIASLGGQK